MKYLSSLFIGFYFTTASAASFCTSYELPNNYLKMKSDTEKSINAFANSKVIAAQADSILSKLITDKSPFVTGWYAKGNFKGKSEEDVAKSWRQYFARSFLLMKYPQGDSKIDQEIEKLVDGLLRKNFNKEFKKQLEKNFATSKALAIETINSMNLSQNKIIIDKINSIKLYWPDHLKTARNNAIPLDLIDWGIAYNPLSNEINIGLNSLSYSNDETLIAVFAHEIGHSFDPCRWSAFYEGKWPFQKVGQCLRSNKSANAKTRDDSKLEAFQKSGKISGELVKALKANPTCNKLAYPAQGIQADQLPETFADWFSAEVISRLKELDVSRLRLDLCEEKTLVEGSSYPANHVRQENIYYAQPVIKNLLKDKSQSKGNYCSM
jgi:hypothetical protein